MTTNADDPTPASDDTMPLEDAADAAAGDTISLDEATVPAAAAAPAAPAAPSFTFAHSVPPATSRPPVRWAGIVWGVLLVVFSSVTLIVVSSPARLAGVTVWIASLTPGAAWALWIALLGLVIVVSALLGAIGAAQRSRRRRTS
ncbi:hypothetical protein [Leifsonia sp. Leaf336]|uniref:hypothetical protein n=1 Tax=Leifsonia sp. Leaf336 TaxID=1736341 RepID=UPI000A8B834B|nr:hypothetical protein [Leifsonia sp. Leaf336]